MPTDPPVTCMKCGVRAGVVTFTAYVGKKVVRKSGASTFDEVALGLVALCRRCTYRQRAIEAFFGDVGKVMLLVFFPVIFLLASLVMGVGLGRESMEKAVTDNPVFREWAARVLTEPFVWGGEHVLACTLVWLAGWFVVAVFSFASSGPAPGLGMRLDSKSNQWVLENEEIEAYSKKVKRERPPAARA